MNSYEKTKQDVGQGAGTLQSLGYGVLLLVGGLVMGAIGLATFGFGTRWIVGKTVRAMGLFTHRLTDRWKTTKDFLLQISSIGTVLSMLGVTGLLSLLWKDPLADDPKKIMTVRSIATIGGLKILNSIGKMFISCLIGVAIFLPLGIISGGLIPARIARGRGYDLYLKSNPPENLSPYKKSYLFINKLLALYKIDAKGNMTPVNVTFSEEFCKNMEKETESEDIPLQDYLMGPGKMEDSRNILAALSKPCPGLNPLRNGSNMAARAVQPFWQMAAKVGFFLSCFLGVGLLVLAYDYWRSGRQKPISVNAESWVKTVTIQAAPLERESSLSAGNLAPTHRGSGSNVDYVREAQRSQTPSLSEVSRKGSRAGAEDSGLDQTGSNRPKND